jgi:hypothetical protein
MRGDKESGRGGEGESEKATDGQLPSAALVSFIDRWTTDGN